MAGVEVPTAKSIVRRVKKRAAENNCSLSDSRNFQDNNSRKGWPKVLASKKEKEVVDFVLENRDPQNMRAKDLHLEPSLPDAGTTTIENTLYRKGLARQKLGWKFALTEDNKAERVALKDYHPDKFSWRDVIITGRAPAKVGAQRGWHRS